MKSLLLLTILALTIQTAYAYDGEEDTEYNQETEGDVVRGIGNLFKSLTGSAEGDKTPDSEQTSEKPAEQVATENAVANNSSTAQLYLYRNMRSIFWDPEHAYALSTTWSIDNKIIGKFAGSSYLKINLEPGRYNIKAALENRPEFEQKYSLPDVKAGQTIYLRYTVSSNRKAKLYAETKTKAKEEVEGLSSSKPVKATVSPIGGSRYMGNTGSSGTSVAGTYASNAVKISINQSGGHYRGSLTLVSQNQMFDFSARLQNRTLQGDFKSSGKSFPFTFEVDRSYKSGTFKTGNFSSHLIRQ